ncbi:MAG: hypothetical protein HFI00_14620 [Lachnospiraceae bacterium]|nr:hypothetical protein [Lachnospiraceae bacterium]
MIAEENKICFIICVNNDLFFEECIKYIHSLNVPDGMEVELMEIREAASMAAGYNEGMRNSNAKYKVYMHQDVFIINRFFINDILSIFNKNKAIGAIGLVGSPKMPDSALMWSADRVGFEKEMVPWEGYQYDINGDWCWDVEAVDGLLIATQYDIPWREDLFDGWDFYDIAYCYDMRKKGLHVVVPKQRHIWFLHDDKAVLGLWNYNKYRQRFVKEYMKDNKQN